MQKWPTARETGDLTRPQAGDMLHRWLANVRAGFQYLRQHPSVEVGAAALIVASLLVGEAGLRLLVALGFLVVLFAAVGAYLGVDLEADARERLER
jgi:hypothetical protein